MDFFALTEKRRSIRKYEERPVEPEKIKKILETALRVPSSKGRQPWALIAVTDKAAIAALAEAKESGASFLADAPLAVVVCGDEAKCDVWIEDASIVCTYVFLAAEALGLGCCWIQMRGRKHSDGKWAGEHIRELLDLPGDLAALAVIAVGYPAEQKPGHGRGDLPFHKVFKNKYGNPFNSQG